MFAALLAGPAWAAAPPWEAQPLAADPREVLKAATAAAAGDSHDVLILLEEARYHFDGEGRCDYRYHLVYRVQTEAGARDWASVGAGWAPWYEERPELRARVTTPDGKAHTLDPATIAEGPVGDDDSEVYSDRRRLRAPLPGIVIGAVVEEEIRVADRTPLFPAGTSYRFYFGSSVPVRRARVAVEAPEGFPVQHSLRGLEGVTVERERNAGQVRLLAEAGPLDALPEIEPAQPSDRPRRPTFALSTGASWASVAEAYSKVVDTQIKIPSPAALRAGVRREDVAARLLKKLHEEVRYTGVELAEAAIVPRPPEEVLARRYGDCKDKSALLVSRLRAEGIPASLALLLTGPGVDVEPGLPGFGSFNHAIVALPGEPTLWIDATDEFARVGELPLTVQDRLALVAAPGTTALTRTPASSSSVNVLRKRREYVLAASGPGRVTETTRATGAVESAYRSYFARTEPKAVRESQERYAKAEHEAAVVSAANGNPRDLSAAFEVRVESAGANRATTQGARSVVEIAPGGLFSRLPDFLGASPEDGGPEGPRRQPFVFVEPHRVEWTYRIEPAPGFVPKSLPETVKEQLGSATVDVQFKSQPDGTVEGRLAFDSGPRALEPKAFDALHEGLRKWRVHEPLRVEFEDKTEALLASGRIAEALSELRRVAEAQPKAAAPRSRYAEALLGAGFGEVAREEARRAIAAEPTSSAAQRTLGWVLEHDLLGRRFKPGSDRAGAEAAYLKAKELDPKNALARSSLAILYEHNDEGIHFGVGARLTDAVREAESLRADVPGYAVLDTNLMLSLMNLRRFEELEKLARSLPPSQNRNELLLIALAARGSAATAIAEAAKLASDPTQRRDSLLHAGNSLIALRLYPQGAALVAESVNGAADASARRARADMFARVRRYEEMTFDEADPRTPVKRFLIAVAEGAAGTGKPEALTSLLALSDDVRQEIEHDREGFRRALLKGMRQATGQAAFSRDVVDLALNVGELSVDGDAVGGFRVRLRLGETSQPFYVVPRDGKRLILLDSPPGEGMAAEAWRLATAGDAVRAARWLDWLRDLVTPTADDDPLAGPPFARLWRADGPRGADNIRIAAASKFGTPQLVAQGVQVLTVWRDGLADGAARRDVELALFALYLRTGRTAEASKTADRLAAAFPGSKALWGLRVSLLLDLGRGPEARALVDQRLRSQPDDPLGLRTLAEMSARGGQYDEAERAFARLASLGRSELGDLNNRAWNAVLRGTVDDAALEWSRQAAKGGAGSSSTLHTLATLYAEKGRVKEAVQVLSQSVSQSANDEPRSDDWYVMGRLAEHCGLTEVARRAYGRVAPGQDKRLDATSVLAARGLARIASAGSKARASR